MEHAVAFEALSTPILNDMGESLDGIRVLDMSRVMSGPFASLMLADMGADVIKVESLGGGDIMRHMGGHQRAGVTAIFAGLNRSKRSIAVDLKTAAGREVVRELALGCDIVLENFRPGVCDSMGLGAAQLRALRPALIYVSMNGFGFDSPSAAEPAYDTMMQGRTGMVARQRRGRDGRPDLVRSFAVDKITGFFAVQSVLAALFARSRDGAGRTVSVPMFDSSLYYLWADSLTDLAFVGDGVQPGTLFPLSMDLTETADGFLTHLAISDRERAGVCRAVGRPDLNDDPRFATTASWSRPENLRLHQRAVAEAFRMLSTDVALARLRAEDVPCAAVAQPADILDDEHVRATGVMDEHDDPVAGRLRQVRYPAAERDGSHAGTVRDVPALGQHGREILIEAGFDPDRVEALVAAGIMLAGSPVTGNPQQAVTTDA